MRRRKNKPSEDAIETPVMPPVEVYAPIEGKEPVKRRQRIHNEPLKFNGFCSVSVNRRTGEMECYAASRRPNNTLNLRCEIIVKEVIKED